MKYFIIVLCFLASSLWGVTIDPSSRSFEMKEKKRTETFDFTGNYSQLERIEIDGKRKMRVEMNLPGEYPVLEEIVYHGGFGTFKGTLTGDFPLLTSMNVLCGNCAMDLDLRGQWHKSCSIVIQGADQDIIVNLPSDLGLKIHTKTSPQGKVIIEAPLEKHGWFSIWSKDYTNDLAETAPIVLTLDIIAKGGRIILRSE